MASHRYSLTLPLFIHYSYLAIERLAISRANTFRVHSTLHSALARLKRSGYLSVRPRPVANHGRYLYPSTYILCVLWTLLVPLSGSQELRDSVAISGRPLNTEMSLPRAPRTGRTRSSDRARPREIRREREREKERRPENGRKRESEGEGEKEGPEPGQTGPRLAEVAPGPQTINKERSNLWTGSLISTLLLFSHLIDGLPRRFVLPRLTPPSFLPRPAASPPRHRLSLSVSLFLS